MANPDPEHLRQNYDHIAADYSAHIYHELDGKPFDREQLRRFAATIPAGGEVCDLGCGPGHIARFLREEGVNVFGVDLSPAMIAEARRLNPEIRFETGDTFALSLKDASLAGVLAFYSIVNFPPESLAAAFREMRRVLRPDGRLLLAFHIGDERTSPEVLWGKAVSLDFYMFPVAAVVAALEASGFGIVEVRERGPYAPDVEFQSRRAYILARAV